MNGIAGIVAPGIGTTEYISQVIDRMKHNPGFEDTALCHDWDDSRSLFVRVTHGHFQPYLNPIFSKDKKRLYLLDGEIFWPCSTSVTQITEGNRILNPRDDHFFSWIDLYETEGDRVLPKLNGSFAIAVYDILTSEITLISDRFSSHPLFFCVSKDHFSFATHLDSLLVLDDASANVDWHAVFEFFSFHGVLNDRTLLTNVKRLPRGSVLRFSDGQISISSYWKQRRRKLYHSFDDCSEALAESLKKAVAIRTTDNRRNGILLSGGLDSRIVLAAAPKGTFPIAFSIENSPEIEIAKSVAKTADCELCLCRRSHRFFGRMEEAVAIGSGMHSIEHALHIGYINKIRDNCDRIFHGYGLDYLFQGENLPIYYIGYFPPPNFILRRLQLKSLGNDIFNALIAKAAPWRVFREDLHNTVNRAIWNTLDKRIEAASHVEGSDVYSCWEDVCPDDLTLMNVLCLRPYIAERTIAFDNDLIEMYLSMPIHFRLSGAVYRRALYILSPELHRIPNANTGIRPGFPAFVPWARDVSRWMLSKVIRSARSLMNVEIGTGSNNGIWPSGGTLLRYDQAFRNNVIETITNPRCLDPNYFDVNYLEKRLQQHLAREGNFGYLFMLVLTFGKWHEMYLSRSLAK